MAGMKYDDVTVGDPIGPGIHEVTATVAREYHEAIDASHPRLTGGGSGLVEPSILGRLALSTLTGQEGGEGMIHAKQQFEFSSPVTVGDTVIAEGEISDKYERRGRKYVEADIELRTPDGTTLGRSVITHVVEAHL